MRAANSGDAREWTIKNEAIGARIASPRLHDIASWLRVDIGGVWGQSGDLCRIYTPRLTWFWWFPHFHAWVHSHLYNMTEIPWTSPDCPLEPYDGPPRNVAYIDQLKFDANLQPKSYSIAGTHPESKVLITNVQIIDATGKEPYRGDVLITGIVYSSNHTTSPGLHAAGERFSYVGEVPGKEDLIKDPRVRVFYGNGRTLIPGLGDAHTHLSWNGGDLGRLGELGVEEHTLLTARSARCFLDSGYTMYGFVISLRAIY